MSGNSSARAGAPSGILRMHGIDSLSRPGKPPWRRAAPRAPNGALFQAKNLDLSPDGLPIEALPSRQDRSHWPPHEKKRSSNPIRSNFLFGIFDIVTQYHEPAFSQEVDDAVSQDGRARRDVPPDRGAPPPMNRSAWAPLLPPPPLERRLSRIRIPRLPAAAVCLGLAPLIGCGGSGSSGAGGSPPAPSPDFVLSVTPPGPVQAGGSGTAKASLSLEGWEDAAIALSLEANSQNITGIHRHAPAGGTGRGLRCPRGRPDPGHGRRGSRLPAGLGLPMLPVKACLAGSSGHPPSDSAFHPDGPHRSIPTSSEVPCP
jgi:hypothetical protein